MKENILQRKIVSHRIETNQRRPQKERNINSILPKTLMHVFDNRMNPIQRVQDIANRNRFIANLQRQITNLTVNNAANLGGNPSTNEIRTHDGLLSGQHNLNRDTVTVQTLIDDYNRRIDDYNGFNTRDMTDMADPEQLKKRHKTVIQLKKKLY